MTGLCPYCGNVWSTNAERGTYAACCQEQERDLEEAREMWNDSNNDDPAARPGESTLEPETNP